MCHHTLPSPAEDLIIGGRRWPHPADLSPVSLPILPLSCPYPCLQVSRYLPSWTALLPNCLPLSVLKLSFPDSSLPPTLSLYNRLHCSLSSCLCVCLPVCVPCCSKGWYIEPGHCLGGFAPQDQWEGLIEYTRYELHVILRQSRQKKGCERRVLHTPCLWPLPHPDTALAGLSWQVYALNHDITCAVLRGIHRVI